MKKIVTKIISLILCIQLVHVNVVYSMAAEAKVMDQALDEGFDAVAKVSKTSLAKEGKIEESAIEDVVTGEFKPKIQDALAQSVSETATLEERNAAKALANNLEKQQNSLIKSLKGSNGDIKAGLESFTKTREGIGMAAKNQQFFEEAGVKIPTKESLVIESPAQRLEVSKAEGQDLASLEYKQDRLNFLQAKQDSGLKLSSAEADEIPRIQAELKQSGKIKNIQDIQKTVDDLEGQLKAAKKSGASAQDIESLQNQLALQKKDLAFVEKKSKINYNWATKGQPKAEFIGTKIGEVAFQGLVMGAIFMVPGMIQQEITATMKEKNLHSAIHTQSNFGNITLQIPDSLILSSHPELSPFLYTQVDPSKGDDAFIPGAHYYVSVDSSSVWAQTFIQSPQFSGVMIDLATGFQFTQDGLSHQRPLIPLSGTAANAWSPQTVQDFLYKFQSKLQQGQMPQYAEGMEAPSLTSSPKNASQHWNNLLNAMVNSANQLKGEVVFGKWKIKALVPRNSPYPSGVSYNTKTNLPANGVYVYQTGDTPLVHQARLAGNTEAFDYVLALDSFGNIVSLHTVKDAQSKAFVPNDQVTSIYSIVNNKVYKSDGTVWQPQTYFGFNDGSLLSQWAGSSSNFNWIQAQTAYMQTVCIKGPFTPLNLKLMNYSQDMLSSSPQTIPVYSTQSTLSSDSSGNPITDYFIAVALINNVLSPINLMFTQPLFLISLVTSRIYTPDGSLATNQVTPTEQIADPTVLAAVQAALAQQTNPPATVAIGQKYVPWQFNPNGLPFPVDYFTGTYGLKDVAPLVSTSRKAWGSPYKQDLTTFESITKQLKDEQAKQSPDKSVIASLQAQLAGINKTLADDQSQLTQEAQAYQFTQSLLFNIYFKIPVTTWIENGNYFYQSVPAPGYMTTSFAPGEYFVMSDSANPSSLTDNIGLQFDSSYPYAISVTSGNVYDKQGNKVVDGTGKAIMFDSMQLLNRVQQNQVKANGQPFLNASGQPLNDMAKAIVASAQANITQSKADLGPFSFYQFQLSIPNNFISAYQSGQYVYQATSSYVPKYMDYVICIEQTTDGKQNFGVKFSAATTSVVSLVTGMVYNRSGITGQYDEKTFYSYISSGYQAISAQVKKSIQQSEADFMTLLNPQPPVTPTMPTLSTSMIAQLNAQQDIPNHPGVRQDPATGNFYIINTAFNTYFDPAAPASAINVLYPKNPPSDVGIVYDDQGKFAYALTGWELQGIRAKYGIQVTSQGQRLMPSNVVPLPLFKEDQNIKAGSSGTGLFASSSAQFPTQGINTVQDPQDQATKYYFYYLQQGIVNGSKVPLSTYLVRQVNSALNIDYYIDMLTGFIFDTDGSLDKRVQELVTDQQGQVLIISRDALGNLNGVLFNGDQYNVWNSQQQANGTVIYSLQNNNSIQMSITARQDKSGSWRYAVAQEQPLATITTDGKGNLTSICLDGVTTYQLASSGSNQWQDSAGTIQVTQTMSSDKNSTVYSVTFLKSPGALPTSSSTSQPSASQTAQTQIPYTVNIVSTFSGTKGYSITNNISGATGLVAFDTSGALSLIQYNGDSYTFKQKGSNAQEFIMVTGDGQKTIRVAVSPTGVSIYTTPDQKEVPNEYAYDVNFISDADLTNYTKNIWQVVPTIDVYGINYLVKAVNITNLRQVQYSDLFVAQQDQDLFNKATTSGVFMLPPTIMFDGISSRYLYQLTAADSGKDYYTSDYLNWFVDLNNGTVFDASGAPLGFSFALERLASLLSSLNLSVAKDATGSIRLKFTPGGTFAPKSK